VIVVNRECVSAMGRAAEAATLRLAS